MKYLKYNMKNTEPIKIANVFTSKSGETDTLNYIPGSAFRGMITNLVLQDFSKQDFESKKKILLSEQVRFLNAYLSKNGNELIPSLKGFYEDKSGNCELTNIVGDKSKDLSGCKRAALGQVCSLSEEVIEYFSVKRKDVLGIEVKGSNIFREDCISENQEFTGFIAFEDDLDISYIIDLLNKKVVRFGNSRTAGYGKVVFDKIEILAENEYPYKKFARNDKIEGKAYLATLSPFAMRRENGSICGIDEKRLEKILGVTNLKLDTASSSVIQVSGFNRVWKARTPAYTMYESGSVFKITFDGVISEETLLDVYNKGIGIGKKEGCGRVIFLKDYENIKRKNNGSITVKEEVKSKIEDKEEFENIKEIINFGLINKKLNIKIDKYILENELKLQGASKSQAGVMTSMCKRLRYSNEGKKPIIDYIEHTLEKESKSKVHSTSSSQKAFFDKITNILDTDLFTLLDIKNENIFDEKKQMIIKFKLIEDLISYSNRDRKE